MRKKFINLFTAALVFAWGTEAALAQNSNTSFEKKANAVSQAAKKSGMMDVALRDISAETSVPQDQVQTMANSHPKAGAGGVLIASVLADETKKPPESFLQTHDSGKSWETIASDNHVSLDKLDLRLNHVQSSVGPASSALTPTGR